MIKIRLVRSAEVDLHRLSIRGSASRFQVTGLPVAKTPCSEFGTGGFLLIHIFLRKVPEGDSNCRDCPTAKDGKREWQRHAFNRWCLTIQIID